MATTTIGEVSKLFPRGHDFTDWARNSSTYVPTTLTEFDTRGGKDSIEIHIAQKACFLTDFRIRADITRIKADGAAYAYGNAETAGATLASSLQLIEKVQILAGNGSGEILFEITDEAGTFLEMMMDDKPRAESDTYGYYKHWGGEVCVAVAANDGGVASYPTGDSAQVKATQMEGNEKYARGGLEEAKVGVTNAEPSMYSYLMLRFKDMPHVVNHIPLMYLQMGITIRIKLRNGLGDGSLDRLVDKAAITGAAPDTPVAVHVPCHFKVVNVKCYTDEAIPSNSYTQSLTQDLQMSSQFNFKWYSIQVQRNDIESTNTSTNIDASGKRVEKTDVVFVNQGSVKAFASSTEVTYPVADKKLAGGRWQRFLPPLAKLHIQVDGQEYPSSETFNSLAQSPECAYSIYLDTYKPVDPIPMEDWISGYNKLRFDYRGHAALYSADNSPAYKASAQGADTSISHLRITTELAGTLDGGADLKQICYNWVPVDIMIDDKLVTRRIR